MQKFIVDHLDPLAQGVDKTGTKVSFISKTLPGEEGVAKLYRKAKGVEFCTLLQATDLNKTSPLRVEPGCSHYWHCQGCHYLHTSYESEIKFKTQCLDHLFKKILQGHKIDVISAPTRSNYRSRIQLHYNLLTKALGLINSTDKKIYPIPNCQLPTLKIVKKIQELYHKDAWIPLASSQSQDNGHLEIQETKSGEIKMYWNQDYAHGGFSQVNKLMNEKLIEHVSDLLSQQEQGSLLDLFSGSGNLSKSNPRELTCLVEYYPPAEKIEGHFLEQDLFNSDALNQLLHKMSTLPKDFKNIKGLIINPPRSGFKNLSNFLNHFTPDFFIYVSCNPQSLKRDLLNVSNKYQIQSCTLLDLFPGTYHFETVTLWKKV